MRKKETIKFCLRLPKKQHEWLKKLSNETKNTDNFISMNDYISIAIDMLREIVGDKK